MPTKEELDKFEEMCKLTEAAEEMLGINNYPLLHEKERKFMEIAKRSGFPGETRASLGLPENQDDL